MDKLSEVQEMILIMLLMPEVLSWSQLERNQWLYDHAFDGNIPAAWASLSRAHRRLEGRGLIHKVKGRRALIENLSLREGEDGGGLLTALFVRLERRNKGWLNT